MMSQATRSTPADPSAASRPAVPAVPGQQAWPMQNRLPRTAVRPTVPDGAPAPQVVYDVLSSPGIPLYANSRARFEARFGRDFSRVRVHTGRQAAASAHAVGAAAYTVGRHVVIGEPDMDPESRRGQQLLAHELRHVIQQETIDTPGTGLVVGPARGPMEAQAAGAAVAGTRLSGPTIQRFATGEHQQIGELAYERARPYLPARAASQPAVTSPPTGRTATAPAAVPAGTRDPRAREYGELVAQADNFASLDDLEQHRRSGVPVLGPFWDLVEDSTRFADLAARNVQHFHPHNFLAWQSWHWHALSLADEAHRQDRAAARLLARRRELGRRFDGHRDRARAALTRRGARAERTAEEEVDRMADVLAQMQRAEAERQAALARADSAFRQAVRTNAFGDHFLTDAFAGGHIVTPRAELLTEYATSLLGLIEVGPVLHCGNIPSLAWHDLDNKFGVPVTSRRGVSWIAFGDNYAHCQNVESCQAHLPTGASLSPTLANAVAATAASLQQLWQAADGRKPTDLSAVLDYLPRPDLDRYPRWTRQQWEAQLRYAATGTASAPAESQAVPAAGGRPGGRPGPGKVEDAPNPEGKSLATGLPLISFGATCLNALRVFSYDKLVVPMLARIRQTRRDRFYYGGQGQLVSPDTQPQPQPHAGGHVVLGSLLGGLVGAGIGALVGGPIGALVGGGLGLLLGGVLGGLL
jgi:hypothetical protein